MITITSVTFQDILKNKGVTLQTSTDLSYKPENGYFVALDDGSRVIELKDFNEKILKEYSRLADTDLIGVWLHGDLVFLDKVMHVWDKVEAFDLAFKEKQLAVYDCKNNEVIFIQERERG